MEERRGEPDDGELLGDDGTAGTMFGRLMLLLDNEVLLDCKVLLPLDCNVLLPRERESMVLLPRERESILDRRDPAGLVGLNLYVFSKTGVADNTLSVSRA